MGTLNWTTTASTMKYLVVLGLLGHFLSTGFARRYGYQGGRTEVNGNERGFGNYGFGCDSIQCLRERNEQVIVITLPTMNVNYNFIDICLAI